MWLLLVLLLVVRLVLHLLRVAVWRVVSLWCLCAILQCAHTGST